MPDQTRIVSPGNSERSVRATDGKILFAPKDWELVLPGDAGLTRRIKAAGPTWTVQEIVRRKKFSRGVWASTAIVAEVRARLAEERTTPEYSRRKEADARRRGEAQKQYVGTFEQAVKDYLAFHPRHGELADKLARAVTRHATPVGSGTVARTKRIPVEQRAEAAVIAWMRHATTAYDTMPIPRIKGKRREIRRMLAARSKALLDIYRSDRAVDLPACPLYRALEG